MPKKSHMLLIYTTEGDIVVMLASTVRITEAQSSSSRRNFKKIAMTPASAIRQHPKAPHRFLTRVKQNLCRIRPWKVRTTPSVLEIEAEQLPRKMND